MSLPLTALTEQYIRLSDLRPKSVNTYRAATRAFVRQFGNEASLEEVERERIIDWRKCLLDDGLAKRSWNTYSSHLKTIAKFGIEEGLVKVLRNPFHKTSVIPPRKQKKTVQHSAIAQARDLLRMLEEDERTQRKRATITPAWFWLVVFETFHLTGIRLNALLSIRLKDVDLENELIVIRGELEKTHREFLVPIPADLRPQLLRLIDAATQCDFAPDDQLFNVNRFSVYYKRTEMNDNQVEAMYTKLIRMTGVRMTPHRFRHTLASDLMRQPERNIHLTKQLMNHSNIATTMEYIEPDYEVIRDAMEERVEAMKRKRRVLVRVDSTAEPRPKRIAATQPARMVSNNLPPTQPPALEHLNGSHMPPGAREADSPDAGPPVSALITDQLLQLAQLLQSSSSQEWLAPLLASRAADSCDPIRVAPGSTPVYENRVAGRYGLSG